MEHQTVVTERPSGTAFHLLTYKTILSPQNVVGEFVLIKQMAKVAFPLPVVVVTHRKQTVFDKKGVLKIDTQVIPLELRSPPQTSPPMPTFSNLHTDKDLARLRQFLSETIQKSGMKQLNRPKEAMQLLNLACGRADETAVLADVFGHGSEQVHLTGIDIRAREIGEAAERWKKRSTKMTTDFLVQDASKLSDLKELGDRFDVAFMRHQNFWNGDTTWTKIYDEALHRLDDDGLLVITSYFDREHHLALDAIQGLGAELVCTERNHDSRLLTDAPAKSVDRHLAIFRKI